MPTFFREALLVQLDPAEVKRGNLRVADGQIADLGPNVVAQQGDEIVECEGAVLMPGLVNGHTHLYSALAAGMPAPPRQPQNFYEILELIWWRLDRAHNLESIVASGQIGALTALRCGTTTLIDHHASPSAIDGSLSALEAGIAEVGCRSVLCYEVTDRNRPTEGAEGLAENERYARECAARNDNRFAAKIGAHASFTMSKASLLGCVDLAKQLGIGVHIHVAEDPVDERVTRERFGCRLLERFNESGLLDVKDSIFAHCTHLSDADITVVNDRASHLSTAHNPSSNMNNAVGYTRVAKFKTPPQLGTDGIGADMWRESRVAEFKSHDAALPVAFGHSLKMLGQSARVASKALGIKLGVLEVGAAADLVLTNYRPATPLIGENLAGHFLFAMGPEFVRDVMIAGWWALRKGHVVTCDEAALRSRSVKIAQQLWERMPPA